jgi:hypothetical protein
VHSLLKITEPGTDEAATDAAEQTIVLTDCPNVIANKPWVENEKDDIAGQEWRLSQTKKMLSSSQHTNEVLRSRCEKASQVGIDVNTNQARKILSNFAITIDEAILRLSPEWPVSLRKKRFTGNYSTQGVEVANDGYRAFNTDGSKVDDDKESSSDNDEDMTVEGSKKEPKGSDNDESASDNSEEDSQDVEVETAHPDEDNEKFLAATMVALTGPKEPKTEPMD